MILPSRMSFREVGSLGALSVTAEVGVAEGLFSRDILSWGVQKHYLVDLWASQPGVRGDGSSPQEWHDANLANARKLAEPYGSRAVFLQGRSDEMAALVREPLDFIYLDANHSYEAVVKDLQAWATKLKPGGILAGHDYLNPAYGVKRAVDEFARRAGKAVHTTELPDGSWWIQ